MVSKEGHCLNDLLYRQSIGAIPIEIPAIVSNHPDLERLAKSYDVPFHHVPVTAATKTEAEAEMLQLVEALGIDLVVLARYMQILSDDACRRLEEPLRAGPRPRREARRRHRALRQPGSGRGSDHRAGRHPCRPLAHRGTARGCRSGRREPGAQPSGALARRDARAAGRAPDRRLPLIPQVSRSVGPGGVDWQAKV